MLVHVAWVNFIKKVHDSFPGNHRLIEWIKSNNKLVSRKLLGCMGPVVNVFILDTEVIEPKSSEECESFWRCVVDEERVLLAVFNQRKTGGVLSESIVFN